MSLSNLTYTFYILICCALQSSCSLFNLLFLAEWWLTYGGECPNLARLAIRILSQTCCLIQHKLDKVSLERLHERKNWLEHQRLSDLAYVQHNMSLKHM